MANFRPLPPLGLLEKHFHYDPDSGDLTNINSGNVAQRLDSKGKYIQVDFQNKPWQAHRFCYFMGTRKNPGRVQVDHRDRVYTNNKLGNLRLLTNGGQQLNTKIRSCNKSGVKGVCWDKKGRVWRSYITIDKKKILLYYGSSKEEAIKERKAGEKKYYPDMFS
jgi:hypothetical protein